MQTQIATTTAVGNEICQQMEDPVGGGGGCKLGLVVFVAHVINTLSFTPIFQGKFCQEFLVIFPFSI